MAWIVERERDLLVRWRDAGTGKVRSRSFRWNTEGRGTGGDFEVTKEDARRDAQELAELKRQTERAFRKPLERVTRHNKEDYPDWKGSLADFIAEGEEELQFANYLQSIVERDSIRLSSKATYLHTLRDHIEPTALGQKNIRFIEPDDVETFWNNLTVGIGAKRNIAQLLRKGFARAVRRGLIEVNPLMRADIAVPSKKTRVRGPIRVLEPEELGQLADATASQRDRLIILVMGYCGLRAGEAGGLTRRDIVRRNGYCELRLHQQVIRLGRERKITSLKTEAGQRSVPVPCSVVDELEAYLEENPPAADGRIFHGPSGELIAAQGINNAVQRAARRASLGPVNSHLLRHTAASMWFDDGMDPESVRKALGHSDIKTTIGQYAHMMKGGAAKLAESMERRREEYRNGKTA